MISPKLSISFKVSRDIGYSLEISSIKSKAVTFYPTQKLILFYEYPAIIPLAFILAVASSYKSLLKMMVFYWFENSWLYSIVWLFSWRSSCTNLAKFWSMRLLVLPEVISWILVLIWSRQNVAIFGKPYLTFRIFVRWSTKVIW